jgi:hypothetical protein
MLCMMQTFGLPMMMVMRVRRLGSQGSRHASPQYTAPCHAMLCYRYAAAWNVISILAGEPTFLAALRKRAVRLFSPCIPPIYPKLVVCGDDACRACAASRPRMSRTTLSKALGACYYHKILFIHQEGKACGVPGCEEPTWNANARAETPCYYSCVTTRAIMFLPIQLSGPIPEPIGSYRGVDTRHAIPEDGLVLTACPCGPAYRPAAYPVLSSGRQDQSSSRSRWVAE